MSSFARTLRLRRMRRRGGAGLLVVPLDHLVTDGPFGHGRDLDGLLSEITANEADAVVLHKGSLRHVQPRWFVDTSLIVHLSAGTTRAPDPDAKCLVTGVAEAIRCGADAVSLHINLGCAQEQRQLADFGAVAGACDRWGMPLLAMMYPRGPRLADQADQADRADRADPAAVAHAVAVAAALGADLVKTVYPGSVSALAEITRGCPIPVLTAGGPRVDSVAELLAQVQAAMEGGAGGVAIGRNIFDAAEPAAVTQKIAGVVHSHGVWS